MCVTDRYDMTLAVKVALNPNTTNNLNDPWKEAYFLKFVVWERVKGCRIDLEIETWVFPLFECFPIIYWALSRLGIQTTFVKMRNLPAVPIPELRT